MEPAAAVSRRVVERHRALGLQFITFLPQDNVVAGQQGTDTDPVSVNVAGLTVLLRLPASEFFSHVLFNEQLHAMVDSHLRHRLKWHEAALAPAGAADTHHHAAALRELDQCVLRLLAREVEQQRAYDSCRGTEAALSDALYDGWVVDVPKLLDVCSLCGPPHARVAARICDAAFRLQPKYWADLAQCMETVPRVLVELRTRLDSPALSVPATMDVLRYLLDVTGSLRSLLAACPGAALALVGDVASPAAPGSLLLALAECYQSLHERTVLQEAAELRAAAMQHATHACHSLLHHVYFERLSGASTSAAAAAQPPAARGVTAAQLEEGLWQAVVVLAEGPQEATSAAVADASTEPQRLDREIRIGHRQRGSRKTTLVLHAPRPAAPASDAPGRSWGALLYDCDRAFRLRAALAACMEAGAVDAARGEYLGTVLDSLRAGMEARASREAGMGAAPGDVGAPAAAGVDARTRGLISEVTAVLSDLGEGFVLACLRAYNMQPDRVVDAVLRSRSGDGELHPAVRGMDPSLPLHGASASAGPAAAAPEDSASQRSAALSRVLLTEEERTAGRQVPAAWRGKKGMTLAAAPGEEAGDATRQRVLQAFSEYDPYADEYDDALDDFDAFDVGDGGNLEIPDDGNLPAAAASEARKRRGASHASGAAAAGAASAGGSDEDGAAADGGDDERGAADAAASGGFAGGPRGPRTWGLGAAGQEAGTGADGAARGRGRGRGGAPRGGRGRGRGKGAALPGAKPGTAAAAGLDKRDLRFREQHRAAIANHNRKRGAARKQARGMMS